MNSNVMFDRYRKLEAVLLSYLAGDGCMNFLNGQPPSKRPAAVFSLLGVLWPKLKQRKCEFSGVRINDEPNVVVSPRLTSRGSSLEIPVEDFLGR
jgi:hypothetical protein